MSRGWVQPVWNITSLPNGHWFLTQRSVTYIFLKSETCCAGCSFVLQWICNIFQLVYPWDKFNLLNQINSHPNKVRRQPQCRKIYLNGPIFNKWSLFIFTSFPLRLFLSWNVPRQRDCQVSECLRGDGLVRTASPLRGHVFIFWSASTKNNPSGWALQRKH